MVEAAVANAQEKLNWAELAGAGGDSGKLRLDDLDSLPPSPNCAVQSVLEASRRANPLLPRTTSPSRPAPLHLLAASSWHSLATLQLLALPPSSPLSHLSYSAPSSTLGLAHFSRARRRLSATDESLTASVRVTFGTQRSPAELGDSKRNRSS